MSDCVRYSDHELNGNNVWYVPDSNWIAKTNSSSDDECRRECISNPECRLWRFNHNLNKCELSGYDAEDIETLKDSYSSGRVKCLSDYNLLSILIFSAVVALIFVLIWYLTKPCNKK